MESANRSVDPDAKWRFSENSTPFDVRERMHQSSIFEDDDAKQSALPLPHSSGPRYQSVSRYQVNRPVNVQNSQRILNVAEKKSEPNRKRDREIEEHERFRTRSMALPVYQRENALSNAHRRAGDRMASLLPPPPKVFQVRDHSTTLSERAFQREADEKRFKDTVAPLHRN
jgi:hypothetical protein